MTEAADAARNAEKPAKSLVAGTATRSMARPKKGGIGGAYRGPTVAGDEVQEQPGRARAGKLSGSGSAA
ncbi:MAG: hypothetical protein FWD68_02130 [Alphaproteobacteria bacterium]|nr:hypothetical protein [Alphaproteobacteria bacterium]